MKNTGSDNLTIITQAYKDYSLQVLNFISSYIQCREDAENLAQDVWLRLLTYDKSLCPETVKPLLFLIARNIAYDFLRRRINARAATDDLMQLYNGAAEHPVDACVSAKDIASFESQRVGRLPEQRRIIYIMSRYEEKTTEEIADYLALSKKTVENHLRLGRRDVRQYMAAIV